jgi:HSP20 family protein
MSLIRYHASPIATLFDELDELVPGGFDWTGRGLTGVTYPNVDIAETETGYTIKADLPGLAREDIKVNVADGVLSVSGEKKREVEKREKNRYYHFERSWGRFCRSFTLPTHVDGNNIEAKYTDGVLEVHLKKSAESKPKAIEVKVE